jgi:hypothetical protein
VEQEDAVIAGLVNRTLVLIQSGPRPIERLREPYGTYRRCVANGCGPECDLRRLAEDEINRLVREAVARQNARRAGLSQEESGW